MRAVRRRETALFNDTATTEIYTLSLHDALPISAAQGAARPGGPARPVSGVPGRLLHIWDRDRAGSRRPHRDRKSTRLNSSHANISYAVFCLKKKKDRRSVIGSERDGERRAVTTS